MPQTPALCNQQSFPNMDRNSTFGNPTVWNSLHNRFYS